MNNTQTYAAETIETINAQLAQKDGEIRDAAEAKDAKAMGAARAEYGRLLKARANAMAMARFH